ncbi:MAG: flavodoxin-dependent (E)-4-hydroxy-3-methylbut-2-enyl-diphosphate synthase [Lentisphaeria bacterium]|nr:flavodoxin-dependent (E)-4-hydroxy-3-methylbut-2-enyl-diphosphate synthase [Lentisphaeria bacterium]
MILRRQTRNFSIGTVPVGSASPVTIQSMCNTRTSDAKATLEQIEELAAIGCDIIRVSVDSPADAEALKLITANSPLPVIADIQFAVEMAVAAIDSGCAAVRLNPGIIRDPVALKLIAGKLLKHNIPVRVGANAGSLPRHEIESRLAKNMSWENAVAEALCDAAMTQCEALESYGVRDIKVALKCSSVPVTLQACREFASRTDYPLHLGLTEAGVPHRGVVKSAAVLGALLTSGIGDTIRVSLTAHPREEITAALQILESCEIRPALPEIIACPTCGRTEIDLIALTGTVENIVAEAKKVGKKIKLRKIAVMGCPVNGPGEARDADLGIAGTRDGKLVIFRKGVVLRAASSAEALKYFAGELTEN